MTTSQRASARPHNRVRQREEELLELLENHVASSATASVVDVLRGFQFNDGYIAAALLAEAKSLIRVLPDKAPWAALLALMSAEATDGRN